MRSRDILLFRWILFNVEQRVFAFALADQLPLAVKHAVLLLSPILDREKDVLVQGPRLTRDLLPIAGPIERQLTRWFEFKYDDGSNQRHADYIGRQQLYRSSK